ncbi:hypothetical protein, partial [Bradyrhizobium japonicum]|uniref:hypothetical protein n=2 Tax=Bradyrhizobium TaxID=374 RepID=UPI001AEBF1FD
ASPKISHSSHRADGRFIDLILHRVDSFAGHDTDLFDRQDCQTLSSRLFVREGSSCLNLLLS